MTQKLKRLHVEYGLVVKVPAFVSKGSDSTLHIAKAFFAMESAKTASEGSVEMREIRDDRRLKQTREVRGHTCGCQLWLWYRIAQSTARPTTSLEKLCFALLFSTTAAGREGHCFSSQ